jgi:glycosyltransferase involved in cell wall biosynthesis
MAHAQQIARAIFDSGCLEAYVTGFAWRPEGPMASMLGRLPFGSARRLRRQLRRRSIDQVSAQFVHSYPFWEIARTIAVTFVRNPVVSDLLWDRMSRSFDALVASRYVPRVEIVQAFEYTALAAFKRAKQLGVARVLHLPSLDSRRSEEMGRREKSRWPELMGAQDDYFDAKFERRYARRCHEIALADVIITNSTLTAQSHICAGADPAKVFAVPLGAPPAIAHLDARPRVTSRPLKVLWAGSFSLRKGAHYLLAGWKQLSAGKAAQIEIYGEDSLPAGLRADVEGLFFHGSIPQYELFEAYETADVLVFPTLSDGFGMVVAEAFAHGLPVITTDQAGAADMVTPDNGIIVPAADPAALAGALQWCLDNRDRLAAMRFHALDTARRRQWSDFRRDLVVAMNTGLQRAGYTQQYKNLA